MFLRKLAEGPKLFLGELHLYLWHRLSVLPPQPLHRRQLPDLIQQRELERPREAVHPLPRVALVERVERRRERAGLRGLPRSLRATRSVSSARMFVVPSQIGSTCASRNRRGSGLSSMYAFPPISSIASDTQGTASFPVTAFTIGVSKRSIAAASVSPASARPR